MGMNHLQSDSMPLCCPAPLRQGVADLVRKGGRFGPKGWLFYSEIPILDYSPECKGLQREMPLQQALSLYGEAELIQADIPYYWDVFNETLDLMEEKSPLVEGSDLEAIYIGLDGLELIYGNDGALAKAVRSVIPDDFDPHLVSPRASSPRILQHSNVLQMITKYLVEILLLF